MIRCFPFSITENKLNENALDLIHAHIRNRIKTKMLINRHYETHIFDMVATDRENTQRSHHIAAK